MTPRPAPLVVPTVKSLAIEVADPFKRSLLPMSVLALDGTQLFVNDAACRLMSRSREALTGTALTRLCRSAADRHTVDSVLSEARAGRRGGVVTCEVVETPERVSTLQLTWTLLTDPQDRPWYITVAFTDETAATRGTRVQERAAAVFRARFDQSSLPQAMLDLDGRLSSVNPAFCALVGRSSEQLQGVALASLAHAAAEPPVDEHLAAVLAGGEQSAQFEHVLGEASGAEIPVHVELTVIRDEAGRPCGAAMFVHDLTEVRRLARQRQRQDAYVDSLSRLAGDVALVASAEGELVYVSPAAERVLGLTQEQLVGAIGWAFVHPDDLVVAQQAYARVVDEGGSCTFRLRLRCGDGSWRWMEETAANRLQESVGGVVCNLRDVHDQVQSDIALAASETRFRAIAETASEGMWLVSPQGDTLFANSRMAEILGVPLEQVYRDHAISLFDPASAAVMAERLATRGERGSDRYEIDFVHPSGALRRLAFAASPLPGHGEDVTGSLKMVSDVTDERCVERELRRAALHDDLTGLPNRALFLDRLEQMLQRGQGRTAVVFIDLDRFKLVNDSRGHDVGDEVLVAVAARLSAAVRQQATVARFGGDEFVVLAENLDEESAQQLCEQLLAALVGSVPVRGAAVHVDASIGVALSPPSSAVDLLRYADSAMYAAKAAGRGRIRLFDPALAAEAEHAYKLSDGLRTALAENTLTMQYQPILDLRSGQVIGMEALARWTDPQYGDVPPNRFVPIAESSGLAPLLDRWAVERALRDARALRRAGALPVDAYVSINLSASNMSDRQLEDFIVTSAAASGLTPANVMLEVTEGAIMTDPDVAIPLLRRLRARGFLLAIDDFGTGHSSLAHLRDLPINYLKIDRSFIADIREDSDSLAVAASVVDLGRAVGMTVIAEGVEEQDQASLLRRLGCHAAQGWLWSRAMSPADVISNRIWATGFDMGTESVPHAPRRRRARPEVEGQHGLDRILSMHQKGASLATIAAALNRDSYLTPAGLRWHQTSVARAVSDAAYPDLNRVV